MRRVIFSVNAAMQRGSNAAPISHQQDGWMRDNGATPTRARMQRAREREREKGEGEGEEERERERERDVQSIMHARTHARTRVVPHVASSRVNPALRECPDVFR